MATWAQEQRSTFSVRLFDPVEATRKKSKAAAGLKIGATAFQKGGRDYAIGAPMSLHPG
jgi:hypothetical protein